MATAEHKFYSDFARKYYADGKAEGRTEGIAGALISLLEQRGFGVDDAERRRILECGDLDQLQLWLGRVLTAKSLAEVFGD